MDIPRTNQVSVSFNKNMESLSHIFLDYAQTQISNLVMASQDLLACRTLDDIADIQSRFMQQSFDRLVGDASKIAQKTATLAKETALPLNEEIERLIQNLDYTERRKG